MPEIGFSPKQEASIRRVEKPTLPSNLEAEYRAQRRNIKDVYRGAWLWHGTGRYLQDGPQTIDVLSGIARSRQIEPHQDTWDATLKQSATVSATWMRPYAVYYSDMHLSKSGEDLLFRDSRSGHWGKYVKQLTARFVPSLIRASSHLYKQKEHARRWMQQRVGQTLEGEKLWKQAWNFAHLRSTIPGDYPILVALKHDAFVPIKTADYIAATEKRTDLPIDVNNVNHIEVPLKNLAETEQALKGSGILIPVIAREFGERFSSEFTDRELLTGEGFAEAAYPIPQERLDPAALEKFVPQKEWFTSPDRAASFYHGSDHLIRVLILQEVLTNLLIENGLVKSDQIDRNALRLAAMAHDMRRNHDAIEPGHAKAAANWALQVYPHGMTQESRDKAFRIILAHDAKIPEDSDVATEINILKTADALERTRLESKLPAAITPKALRKYVALDQSRLQFELAKDLVPMANDLFRLSTYDETKRVDNPKGAVFDSARQMGLLKAA